MDAPFCRICGERHRLGHCPLYDEPPVINHVAKTVPADDQKTDDAEGALEEPAAPDPWREIYDQARSLAPEDMKQETMPEVKARFDRNKYQRDLMRRRYAEQKSVRSAVDPKLASGDAS
jgi:hypothetical protein